MASTKHGKTTLATDYKKTEPLLVKGIPFNSKKETSSDKVSSSKNGSLRNINGPVTTNPPDSMAQSQTGTQLGFGFETPIEEEPHIEP